MIGSTGEVSRLRKCEEKVSRFSGEEVKSTGNRWAEDALREEYFDGESWTADYRRLRFVAVKE